MIGQFLFFALFIFTLWAGAFVYFSPKQQPLGSSPIVMDNRDNEMTEDSSTKESQQLNVKTINGIVQIHRQMDELSQEQKKLMEVINYDQQVLNTTNKEISDILKQVNGNTDLDVLRLKPLVLALQNNQRLLEDHGQVLIAFNNQLTKRRKWLAEQNYFLNYNNDQSPGYFDKITEQNDDIMEHTQDLIDGEREKVQDQQSR